MKRLLVMGLMALGASACVTSRPMLVAPFRADASGSVIFRQVRVFDGEQVLPEPMDVVVREGRVAEVVPAGQGVTPPQAEEVQGEGRTLLPGLVDAHAHLGGSDGTPPWAAKLPNIEAQAAAELYAGVTTLLNPGRDTDLVALEHDFDSGAKPGPHLLRASRYFTAVGGHPVSLAKAVFPWPFSSYVVSSRMAQVTSVDDVRAALDREVPDAPSFIKVMYDDLPLGSPHLSPEQLRTIVEEAHRRGFRVAVHIASPQDAMECLDAGVDLLMHVPWDGELTDEQAGRLAQSGVPLVTTRRIYGVQHAILEGTLQLDPLEREVMPTGMEAALREKPSGYQPPGFTPEYLAQLPRYEVELGKNVARLHAAGAKLIVGTDSGLPGILHGASVHRELQSLVELGISPVDVLAMATSRAAHALVAHPDFGTIAPGARADLVLVDGDPTADVAATERLVGVWKDGRRVERVKPEAAR